MSVRVQESIFGYTGQGQQVMLYQISNDAGMTVKVTNYGATITSIHVPDKSGLPGEVVLGFDKLEAYLCDHPYFGATIGRVANRIAGSRFELDGKSYSLAPNDGINHLHGGEMGFDKVVWNAAYEILEDEVRLVFSYLSRDGEQGYPGNVDCKTIISVYSDNRIDIAYNAECDSATIINMTHHEYFNLKDGGHSPILDHQLLINAETYTPTDEDVIVNGEIKHVNDTHFDFRNHQTIGSMIKAKDGDIIPGKGYDHNFILSKKEDHLGLAAILREPQTCRQLVIKTTKDCMQLYTASKLEGSLSRAGIGYAPFHAICLECQSFPDAINHDHFPPIVLRPGELYSHTTRYRFSIFEDTPF